MNFYLNVFFLSRRLFLYFGLIYASSFTKTKLNYVAGLNFITSVIFSTVIFLRIEVLHGGQQFSKSQGISK